MRRIVIAAFLLCACGGEWVWSDREPTVIRFSADGDCDGADVIEDTGSTLTCEWGCAVVSYDGAEPCTELAHWTHVYDRLPGGGWAFRRQLFEFGCWELH